MCLALDPDQRPATVSVVAARLLVARDEITASRAATAAQQASLLANTPALSLASAQTALHDPPLPGAKTGGNPSAAAATPERPPVRVMTASNATTRSAASHSSRSVASSSNAAYPNASASARSAASSETGTARRSPALFLVPALLAVIVGSVAVAVRSGRAVSHLSNAAMVTPPVYVKPAAPDGTGSSDPNPAPATSAATPAPVAPGLNSAAAPVASANPNVSLPSGSIRLQSALLPVANDLLPIALSGTVQGQANTQLQLAVYFFDAKGQPIEAIDISNVAYTNAQKYLCTYRTLSILSDDQTVQETLSVPTRLLQGAARPTPYTYQVMLFQDGVAAPIYKSGLSDLPPGAYGGANVASQGSPSAGNGASAPPRSVISPIHVGN